MSQDQDTAINGEITEVKATLDRVIHQATDALLPLTDELDATPEQKLEVCMNAVRVTHNANMLAKAFDITRQIQDKTVRAEALIDIINEANYQLSL